MKKFGILLSILVFIGLILNLNPSSNVSNNNIHHFVEKIPLEYTVQLMMLNRLPFKYTTNDYSMDITERTMDYKEHWINKNHRLYMNTFISKGPQVWGYDYDNPNLIMETITIKNSSGIYTRNEVPILDTNDKIVTEDIHFTKDTIHYYIGHSYKINEKKQIDSATFIEFVDKQLQPYNDLSFH